MDVAINGEGFFQVQRPDGTTGYTRDGSFKRDASGVIVTSDGYHLIPEVTIPSGATAVNIAPNGTVSAILAGANEPTELGQVQIVTFTNSAGLNRVGQNLFTAGGASGDAQVVNTWGERHRHPAVRVPRGLQRAGGRGDGEDDPRPARLRNQLQGDPNGRRHARRSQQPQAINHDQLPSLWTAPRRSRDSQGPG